MQNMVTSYLNDVIDNTTIVQQWDGRNAERRFPDVKAFNRIFTQPSDLPTWRLDIGLLGSCSGLSVDIRNDMSMGLCHSADICLEELNGHELGVSRRHAILRPSRDGIFLIDQGSTNGTFVNGLRLINQAVKLNTGDVVSLSKLHTVVLEVQYLDMTTSERVTS